MTLSQKFRNLEKQLRQSQRVVDAATIIGRKNPSSELITVQIYCDFVCIQNLFYVSIMSKSIQQQIVAIKKYLGLLENSPNELVY